MNQMDHSRNDDLYNMYKTHEDTDNGKRNT